MTTSKLSNATLIGFRNYSTENIRGCRSMVHGTSLDRSLLQEYQCSVSVRSLELPLSLPSDDEVDAVTSTDAAVPPTPCNSGSSSSELVLPMDVVLLGDSVALPIRRCRRPDSIH